MKRRWVLSSSPFISLNKTWWVVCWLNLNFVMYPFAVAGSLWKEMVLSHLNQHLTLIAIMWTVILVMKLIITETHCEDVLVLQGPSSLGYWEKSMKLQIMNKIQKLICLFLFQYIAISISTGNSSHKSKWR